VVTEVAMAPKRVPRAQGIVELARPSAVMASVVVDQKTVRVVPPIVVSAPPYVVMEPVMVAKLA